MSSAFFIIQKYTDGEIRVLLLNAKYFGSGLNLQMTSDIITYFSTQHQGSISYNNLQLQTSKLCGLNYKTFESSNIWLNNPTQEDARTYITNYLFEDVSKYYKLHNKTGSKDNVLSFFLYNYVKTLKHINRENQNKYDSNGRICLSDKISRHDDNLVVLEYNNFRNMKELFNNSLNEMVTSSDNYVKCSHSDDKVPYIVNLN